jgi:ABC-type Mn2+/Zn2+ transport system ATPase subunit
MNKNKKISEITKIFGLVGFNTVKSWLKPYHVLSNGEKMRVDLARALLSDNKIIVFDEYTSVVDRTVAKTMTLAISKLKEKLDKQIILVSVHDDILEYLDYDWSFNTNNYSFKKKQNISNQNYNSKLENLKHQNKNNIFGTYVKNIII